MKKYVVIIILLLNKGISNNTKNYFDFHILNL